MTERLASLQGAFLAAYCALAFNRRKSDDFTNANIPNPDIRNTFVTTFGAISKWVSWWNNLQIFFTYTDSLKV